MPPPWTKAEDKLLGTHADEAIAQRLGRHVSTVARHRRKLGISGQVRIWTPEEDKMLGTVPDRQLVQRIGRSLQSIQQRRHVLGIPPADNPNYRRRKKKET